MNKKSIIITYWQKDGNMVTGVIELIKLMKENEINFFLISQLNKDYDGWGSDLDISIYNSPSTKIGFINLLLFNIFSFYNMVKIIHNNNIKLLHCINIGASPAAIIVSAIFNIKISYNIRAPNVEFYLKHMSLLHKYLLKKSHKIFVISKGYKKLIINTYSIDPKKIQVLPVGVNLELFNPKLKYKTMEQVTSSHNKIILYVGSIDKNRNLQIIINALYLLVKYRKDIKLYMIGSGNDILTLKKKSIKLDLSDYIIFKGRIPYNKIPYYIHSCHVALSPIPNNKYYSISSPLKTLEYMAMKKPVIASNIQPHRNIIKNKFNGILVKWDEPNEYYHAIKYILNNEDKAKKMGLNARSLVERKYDYKIIYKKIITYFNKLL